MKPDWRGAPEWANFLAMDADGEWHWFEYFPEELNVEWAEPIGRVTEAGYFGDWPDWQKSLEASP